MNFKRVSTKWWEASAKMPPFKNQKKSTAPISRWSIIWFYVPIDRSLKVHAWINYQSILQKCVVDKLSRGSVSGTILSSTENCVEHDRLFIGDVEPDNKLHEWVVNVAHVNSPIFCLVGDDINKCLLEEFECQLVCMFRMYTKNTLDYILVVELQRFLC